MFVLIFGVILWEQSNQTIQPDHTGGIPIYLASDWVKDHVSYRFREDVVVPAELPHYELQYIPFDRASLDELVRPFNAALLDGVTVGDDAVTYQTVDQSFFVQQQQDGSVNFEYHLFRTPEGTDYTTENRTRLTHEEQLAAVQAWLAQYPQFANGYQTTIMNKVHGEDVETLYLATEDGAYRFEAANFGFYNGQLQTVYGWVITGIDEVGTVAYGTNMQIERYLNSNPVFPYYSNTFPENVNVRYQLTGFRQSPLGLEIDYEMVDAEVTRQALNISHPGFIGEGSAYGTLAIGNVDEQAAALAEIERYRQEID